MHRELFKVWLEKKGYSVLTPSGKPSTVYDYVKRVNRVIEKERLNSWEDLATNIEFIVRKYDKDGEEEKYGKTSNNAVISALKQFSKYLKDF